MSVPACAASPTIAAEIIPQLAAAAARIAAVHEEPAPASIAAVATTRVKALEVLFGGTRMPARYDLPSCAIVMTGHFASYRGAPPRSHIRLPRRGPCLVAVLDTTSLMLTDTGLHDQDDTGLLTQLGPVTNLRRGASRPTPNP